VGGSKTKAAATSRSATPANVMTTSSTTIDLFATSNGQIDDNSTLIRSMVKDAAHQARQGPDGEGALRMIPAVADGSYTIIARITDQAAARFHRGF